MTKKYVAMLSALITASMILTASAQEEEVLVSSPQGMKVDLPCIVFSDCDAEGAPAFIPSGWMGATDAIEMDDCWSENPHSGSSCMRLAFSDPASWGGIVWQNPANNWGDEEGGVDLRGAKQLSFWARGDKGDELVEFKFGVIRKNKPFYDTGRGSLGKVKLTPEWKQYIIPLDGQDLSQIVSGFVYSVKGRREPVIFYLDDIVFE
ncbi:MAG: hypothetical protein PHP44_07035 [Kiritimatiellae bacterium]|nr:hypothetical protein [Kiritimatiellia bacterium]